MAFEMCFGSQLQIPLFFPIVYSCETTIFASLRLSNPHTHRLLYTLELRFMD
jgi:hypothetical protein